jgi:hypothetical protein
MTPSRPSLDCEKMGKWSIESRLIDGDQRRAVLMETDVHRDRQKVTGRLGCRRGDTTHITDQLTCLIGSFEPNA